LFPASHYCSLIKPNNPNQNNLRSSAISWKKIKIVHVRDETPSVRVQLGNDGSVSINKHTLILQKYMTAVCKGTFSSAGGTWIKRPRSCYEESVYYPMWFTVLI